MRKKKRQTLENTKVPLAETPDYGLGSSSPGLHLLKKSCQNTLERLLTLLETYKKGNLSGRRRDLTEIYSILKEFLDIQQQELMDSIQARMLEDALKRLIELNVKVERAYRKCIWFREINLFRNDADDSQ